MIRQKLSTTLLLVLIPSISALTSYSVTSAREAISTTPDTSTIRQMIGREKVVAFSKDYLIKSGLDAKDLAKWEAIIKTSLSYIVPSKKEGLLPNTDRLFATLDNAYAFVKEAVKKLNATYGPLYIQGKGAYVPRFDTFAITPATITELESVNRRARELKEKILNVAQTAFTRHYINAQQTPETWVNAYIRDQKGSLKSAEELFPGYTQFLKDYATSNYSYDTFKKSYSSKYGLIAHDEKSFANLLEQIERCDYRLEKNIFSVREGKKRDQLKKFAESIRAEFPTILTSLDFYKIGKNTSMQRTVLSAYAEAMEGVLNQIIRETKTLLDAIKSAKK